MGNTKTYINVDKLKVVSFKKIYRGLTKKMRDNIPEEYYFQLFKAILIEGNEGYKHLKILSATNSGTPVKYAPIESEEESEEARASLLALAKEYNEKYNTGIEFEEEEIDE